MNDYITTTKQSTTKPCAYLLEYTVIGPVLTQIENAFGISLPEFVIWEHSMWTKRKSFP